MKWRFKLGVWGVFVAMSSVGPSRQFPVASLLLREATFQLVPHASLKLRIMQHGAASWQFRLKAAPNVDLLWLEDPATDMRMNFSRSFSLPTVVKLSASFAFNINSTPAEGSERHTNSCRRSSEINVKGAALESTRGVVYEHTEPHHEGAPRKSFLGFSIPESCIVTDFVCD